MTEFINAFHCWIEIISERLIRVSTDDSNIDEFYDWISRGHRGYYQSFIADLHYEWLGLVSGRIKHSSFWNLLNNDIDPIPF